MTQSKKTKRGTTKARKTQSSSTATVAGKATRSPLIMETIMTKGNTMQFDKMAHEAANGSKEYMDSCMKGCSVMMKGMENLVKTQSNFMQSFSEKQMKFFNDAIKSKTLNEWTEIQSSAAQENMNDLMEIATTASEQIVKIATEVLEPINSQFGKTMGKAMKMAA
jgi:phasin family protein